LVDRIVASRTSSRSAFSPDAAARLTDREREVLMMIARGLSNREIATRLCIAELTAKTHVSRVLTKLGVASRVQAAVFAYETRLVRPGDAPPVP
jgi:DNA-binding NarL/FixJ family response regulator